MSELSFPNYEGDVIRALDKCWQNTRYEKGVASNNNSIITNVHLNCVDCLFWSPSRISTYAWYDASDLTTITESGGLVSKWDDKSGNSNHAIQNVGSKQPTTSTRDINGVNVLDFDGVDNILEMTSSIDFQNKMMFAVVEFDPFLGPSINYEIMGSPGNENQQWRLNKITSSTSYLQYAASVNPWRGDSGGNIGNSLIVQSGQPAFVAWKGGDFLKLYLNATEGTEVEDRETLTPISIGRIGSGETSLGATVQQFNGKIGEVIIMDIPTTEIQQKTEGYLAWKWGLEANLPLSHPYKAQAPV